MKCPKCAYLGFETTERCRNCGYDFSLAITIEPTSELPLRSAAESEGALPDFDLSRLDDNSIAEPAPGLDLDRLIGASEPVRTAPNLSALDELPVTDDDDTFEPAVRMEAGPSARAAGRPSAAVGSRQTRTTAVATPPPEDLQEDYQPAPVPRPALPPLAVRRTTPEIARRRTPRTVRRDEDELPFQLDTSTAALEAAPAGETGSAPASRVARVAAAIVDLVLLAGINAGVLYLTLAIAGLSFAEVRVLPRIPMAAFLLMLNGGYLIGFTAAGGQTIGKMIAGIRVIGDDDTAVDVRGAVFRCAGVAVSCAALGLPYLPALMSSDGRALHDRLAGTRVIKNA